MTSPLELLIMAVPCVILALVIIGIILLFRFVLKICRDNQRTRLEIGKIAEELSLIRKNQDASSDSRKSEE